MGNVNFSPPSGAEQHVSLSGRTRPQIILKRVGSTALLGAVLGFLLWGAFWQPPRTNPFEDLNELYSIFSRDPDPAYAQIPVVPSGSNLVPVPRGVCATSSACAGTVTVGASVPNLRDTRGQHRLVAALYVSATSGQLFAITPSGQLFTLSDQTPRAWAQVQLATDLPAPTVTDAKDLLTNVPTGLVDPRAPMASSADGRWVAFVSSVGGLGLFSRGDSSIRYLANGRFAELEFSQDGRMLLTLSHDNTAEVWNVAELTKKATLHHEGVVTVAHFSADGQSVVTVSGDGIMSIWSLVGRRLAREFRLDTLTSTAVLSPNNESFATIAKLKARLWNAVTGVMIADIPEPTTSIAFSPDQQTLVTGAVDGILRIRGMDGTVRDTNDQFKGKRIYNVRFDSSGGQVEFETADGPVHYWTVSPQQATVTAMASSASGVVCVVGDRGYVAFTKDGQTWESERRGEAIDFIDVAAYGQDSFVALTSHNSVVFFSPLTGERQRLLDRLNNLVAGEKEEELHGGRGARFRELQRSEESTRDRMRSLEALRGPSSTEARFKIPGDKVIRSLWFRNDREGWAVGDGGLIVHTRDGGLHWSELFSSPGLDLQSIRVEGSGVGWAIGRRQDGRLTVVAADQAALGQQDPVGWHERLQYVGRWLFILGIPALILSGWVTLRAWRPAPAAPQESIEEVGSPDQPLRWSDPDSRLLKPIARSLARFLRNVNTKPPLTLSISGRWGSGKSSLMQLVMEELRYYNARAVWFNAWHHRDEDDLLAALFAAIRRRAAPEWWSWPGLTFRLRLFTSRSRPQILALCYGVLFAGIFLLTLHSAGIQLRATQIAQLWKSVAERVGEQIPTQWRAVVGIAVGVPVGSTLATLLVLWFRSKIVAVPANPAKLAAAIARRATLSDFDSKLAFRSRFGEQFGDVCEALLGHASPGLIIFVDDLDRCQPEDVLKLLEAVNYLVSAGRCTVILGMDRRQVEYCVASGFEKLVEGLPADELIYAAEETNDKAGKQRAYARHYLEKLINIDVPVPLLDDAATSALLLRGTQESAALDPIDGPKWLRQLKPVLRNVFAVLRVGFLAFLAGVAGFMMEDRLQSGLLDDTTSTPVSDPVPSQSGTTAAGPARSAPGTVASGTAPLQPTGVTLIPIARVEIGKSKPTLTVASSRRWIWWGPTVAILVATLLFGVTAASRARRSPVKDSPNFAKALRCVKPLMLVMRATPRVIKRYQNRMRYFAARLRPVVREPDFLDGILHWIGRRIGKQLVPAEWFDEDRMPAIREPALILLGAIELFAPKAFTSPVDLLSQFTDGTPGNMLTAERTTAWNAAVSSFIKEGLDLPNLAEIIRYSGLIGQAERPPVGLPGSVVPFPRPGESSL